MLNKLLLTIGFGFVLWLKHSSCQEIPVKYSRVNSSFYQFPTDNIEINKLYKVVSSRAIWVVYSDRANNKAYKFSDKASPVVATLNFMDKFMVGKEENEWLYLIRDENARGDNPSSLAKPIGWVQKADLLLWGHCVVTESSVNKKAMIVNSKEFVLSDDFKKANADNVTFASHPSLDLGKYSTGKKANIKNILYIYKKENGAYLLGASPSLGGNLNILGWVNINRVENWNHRVALEPNWYDDAASNRQKENGIKILTSSSLAIEYFNTGKVENKDNVIWDFDPYNKRFPGEFIRFPFLKLMKNKVAKVGLVANVLSENSNSQGDESTPAIINNANIKTILGVFIEKQDKVNLIFVLDGTKSITPYFPAIVRGIQDGISTLSNKEIKFAAVVYSDKKEGNYEIQKQDITTKDNLISFLKDKVIFPDNSEFSKEDILNGWGRNSYKSNDEDMEEALYKGLDVATNELNLEKNETNVFILIGDYGNNSDTKVYSTNKIAKDLAEISQGFLIIQAKRPNDLFISECDDILSETALSYYNRLKGIIVQCNANEFSPPEFEKSDQSHVLISSTPYSGWLKFPSSINGEISSAEISKEIKDIVQKTKSNNISMLKQLEDIIKNGGVAQLDRGINRKALLWIEQLKKNKIENFNLLNSVNVEIFTTGYTTLSSQKSKYPYYNRVLFVSKAELNNLIGNLQKLNPYEGDRVCDTDFRKCIVNAWIGILVSTLGNKDEKDILEMPYDSIQRLVYGLPPGRESNCIGDDLLKAKLKCLLDPSCINDDQLNKYSNYINESCKYLKSIYESDKYPYTIKNYTDSQTYYWIEEKYLP